MENIILKVENFVKDFPDQNTKQIRYQIEVIIRYFKDLKYLSAFNRVKAISHFKKTGNISYNIFGITATINIDNFLLNYLKTII